MKILNERKVIQIEFNDDEVTILKDISMTNEGVPDAVSKNIPGRDRKDVYDFLKKLQELLV